MNEDYNLQMIQQYNQKRKDEIELYEHVKQEALRFIKQVDAHIISEKTVGQENPGYYSDVSYSRAAAKRAALDLKRALTLITQGYDKLPITHRKG